MSKPVKILLSVVLGLVVAVSVIAMATSASAEDDLVDGLRAVNPALVTADAVDRARTVCTEGVTVAHIVETFYVDVGVAARLTAPLTAYCNG